MGQHTKLAVLLLRIVGVTYLVYAVPMFLYIVIRVFSGATTTSDGTPLPSAMTGWSLYGIIGALHLLFARPLARLAARGLDGGTGGTPAHAVSAETPPRAATPS